MNKLEKMKLDEIEKNISWVLSPRDLKSAFAASPLSLGAASIPWKAEDVYRERTKYKAMMRLRY